MFFCFEIIPFQLISLNTRFYSQYLSSGVNMLKNSLEIADTTKKEFLELIFFQWYQKIGQKYCRADLCSLLDTLTW